MIKNYKTTQDTEHSSILAEPVATYTRLKMKNNVKSDLDTVKDRLRQMESGEVKMIPGEQVFAEIRDRYGFKA